MSISMLDQMEDDRRKNPPPEPGKYEITLSILGVIAILIGLILILGFSNKLYGGSLIAVGVVTILYVLNRIRKRKNWEKEFKQ